jgi:hypothetical protein
VTPYKLRKKAVTRRSQDMPNAKRLRIVFYLLAAIELMLVSIAWGQLPLH